MTDKPPMQACLAHTLIVPCGLCKLRGARPDTYTDDPKAVREILDYIEMRSKWQ